MLLFSSDSTWASNVKSLYNHFRHRASMPRRGTVLTTLGIIALFIVVAFRPCERMGFTEDWENRPIISKYKSWSQMSEKLHFIVPTEMLLESESVPAIPAHLFDISRDLNMSIEDIYVSDAAQLQPKKGRLMCFVITTPKYYSSRVLAINETWLPRCDHGQFFTNLEMDPSIPHSTVLSRIPDDYEYLFHKTLLSFYYAFTEVSSEFDWYFKADDDTYVVMEHMYEYLATLNPEEPYYLGYTLKPYLARGYNGGGAGYVLSRAAVKLFLKRSYGDRETCPFDPFEDLGMGRCLQNVEIFPHDTRNEKGQHRFHTYRPDDMFYGRITDEWHYYTQINGHEWIAPDLISLHHMTPDEIRTLDDLLYRMRSPQLSPMHKKFSLIPEKTPRKHAPSKKEMRGSPFKATTATTTSTNRSASKTEPSI